MQQYTNLTVATVQVLSCKSEQESSSFNNRQNSVPSKLLQNILNAKLFQVMLIPTDLSDLSSKPSR